MPINMPVVHYYILHYDLPDGLEVVGVAVVAAVVGWVVTI